MTKLVRVWDKEGKAHDVDPGNAIDLVQIHGWTRVNNNVGDFTATTTEEPVVDQPTEFATVEQPEPEVPVVEVPLEEPAPEPEAPAEEPVVDEPVAEEPAEEEVKPKRRGRPSKK